MVPRWVHLWTLQADRTSTLPCHTYEPNGVPAFRVYQTLLFTERWIPFTIVSVIMSGFAYSPKCSSVVYAYKKSQLQVGRNGILDGNIFQYSLHCCTNRSKSITSISEPKNPWRSSQSDIVWFDENVRKLFLNSI